MAASAVPALPMSLFKNGEEWVINSPTEYWSAIFEGYAPFGTVSEIPRSQIRAFLSDIDAALGGGGTGGGGGIVQDANDLGFWTVQGTSSITQDATDPGFWH